MKKILITGGTTFVSKVVANHFVQKGMFEVYVINRNTKPQVEGVHLIEAERHNIGDALRHMCFDVVLDINAYNRDDIVDLLDGLGSFSQYVMISSSAVYAVSELPLNVGSPLGPNRFWGDYGTNKIEAEKALLLRVPDAYIIRPPYIYGVYNNVYREAFVFDCAIEDRKFYLPGDGSLKLQFYNVVDLCVLIENLIKNNPSEHIINVGNRETVSVKDWVTMCYSCLDKVPQFVNVDDDIEWRNFFCFRNYEYYLDVESNNQTTIPLIEGLRSSLELYLKGEYDVVKRPYIDYIKNNLE